MHYSTNIFLPLTIALSALSTTASAAECFKQTGAKNCISWDAIWKLRDTYCKKYWSYPGIVWLGKDGDNIAQFAHTTHFGSQQECWDSFDQIAHDCHGHANGGTWSWNANTAVLDFCVTLK